MAMTISKNRFIVLCLLQVALGLTMLALVATNVVAQRTIEHWRSAYLNEASRYATHMRSMRAEHCPTPDQNPQ